MAFTFDTQLAAGHTPGSPATDSFTMGVATHGILIAFSMAIGANGVLNDYLVGSMTYNGVAMTFAARDGAAAAEANQNLEVWYMIDPPSGAHNLVTTLNGTPSGRPINWVTSALSYKSDGVLSVSNITNGNGTTNAPTLTVTTTPLDHAFAGAWAVQQSANVLSAGPTNERQNFSASQDAGISEWSSFADADKDAVGASTTLAWTSTLTQHWHAVGFSMREAVIGISQRIPEPNFSRQPLIRAGTR